MACSIEYLEFVLDLLQDVPAVTHKKMMGEYLLYSGGVLFGGVYDDRFLLKDTPAARKAFPQLELPYDGANEHCGINNAAHEHAHAVVKLHGVAVTCSDLLQRRLAFP